ncbi:hypothetical protein VTN96DRAFT_8854 [Rasamsonia emersonii]|uniref:Myb-like domain-containing protein n=1 Tax=Rasamsonia emersonii (strain ATCC 16479 / CBS 393.64 / IMI 116815) TaxID=1408163 RepID=A0A0F4YWQ8_RASE3|nr:hypothetical protein T310_3331 [Rasamsonia emersonii CBS 393.64]KKA22649.1 hypothetical protein T310_3331 [Rasamsonia emersonii CBS 393.64]
MSTTSLYEPDEDDEVSDSDARSPPERSGSSLSRLRQSSSPEQDEENDPSATLSRASQTASSRLRAIRRKGLTAAAADAYRAILREAVDDLSPPAFESLEFEYNPRVCYQLGVVTWNIYEREMFFNLLARKGKNAIREIADAIPSKSELEVQEYLKLLHKGSELQQLHERHHRSTTLLDIPAAAEISDECCLALDEFSEYVALKEQEADDKAGTKKHGDFWIIDGDKARQVEQLMASHDSPPPESSIFLTASLLNIKRWIQLSERFFMNFGGSRFEDNWVNIAFKDESPSLTADAFADFYALTVSITRRIVQSTLFFAMSRIRNVSYHKVKNVKPRDVRAALDVLNMKHNSFDFWVGLARRCNLEVADIRHKKGWKAVYMGYDEVEDALSGRRLFSKSRERSASRQRMNQNDEKEEHDDEEIDEDDDDPIDDEEDEYVEEDDDDESSPPPSPRSTHSLASSVFDEEAHADEEDIYTEYIDQQRSRDEELRIRELLQCPLMDTFPPIIKTEDDHAAAPPKPVAGRKRKEDLVDWRERTLYRSEWEEYGRSLSAINEELAENRRKRRRLENPTPFTRSSRRELRRSSVQEQSHNDDDDDDDANMLDTSDGELGEESHYEEAPDSEAEADVEVEAGSEAEIEAEAEAEAEAETEMEAADMTESEERPVVEVKMEEDAREHEDTHLPLSSGHESSPHGSAAQQEDSDDGG